jgi:hypothetical protein
MNIFQIYKKLGSRSDQSQEIHKMYIVCGGEDYPPARIYKKCPI